jgi:outer membrane receptor protein involved in Fe transport
MRPTGVAVLVTFITFAAALDGQVNATGSFSGLITDPAGKAVAHARIQLTDQQTGISSTRFSGGEGYYVFPLVKPGVYSIEVSAPEFAVVNRRDLILQIQEVIQQDFQLEVAGAQQEVTVTGAAPLLDTETTEVGNVISEHTAQQLPLNGRNFSQLALLVPGTNPGPVGGIRTQGNGNETQRAGAEVIADGSRGSFNLFLIDGLDDRDQSVGTLKVFPTLEAIDEFKVQVGNYDAAFASGGAVVNVVTRSGTNEFHGSAFEFLRNSDLDARQFFDARKPQFQQNQFGGSIGGPIRKNKTFFFGDYQGLRVHSAATSILTVPTVAMRAGDFSAYPAVIYDPNSYNPATNTRAAFQGNRVPGDSIDPIARNLLAIFPLPNLPGVANNLRINPLQVNAQDQLDVRGDQVLGQRDTMFARYTWGRANITYPDTPVMINGTINPLAFAQGSTVAGSLTLNHAPSQQATWQEIHQFTPNITNQLALGYTRFFLQVSTLASGTNIAQKLGLIGADTGQNAADMASLVISSETGYNSGSLPEIIPQNTWQLSDTVSYTRGAHNLRFGFSDTQSRFGFFQLSAPSGSLLFTGTYTNNPASPAGTGAGFADFLLGLPVSSAKSTFPEGVPYLRYSEYGGFVQDQWRATSRLTLNLGLRYDLFTPVSEQHNRLSDLFLHSGTLVLAGQNGISSSILQIQKHDFSPRIGAAYRLGDKTVIRIAYGLFYFNEEGAGGSSRLFINYPFTAQFTVSCSSTAPCLSTSSGIPQTVSANNLPTAVYQPSTNLTPNMQEWNLTLERQVATSLVLRASYVGSHGNHLNLNINENVAFPGPGPVPPRQPYPSYGTISAWEPRGFSNYDGLQLSAEKRFSGGLSFLAAYTWSKSLDEGAGGNSSTGESRINIQNPRDVRADYGPSNFDYRQRFTLSLVYEPPFGHGRRFLNKPNRVADGVLGGWQATSILTAQSGAPFSVSLANPTANTGTFTRPNRVCDGNLPSDKQSVHEWYDVACFVSPQPFTFGNTGRNVLIGPGLFTWDLGADKDFRLDERVGLQFRSEFFNVLNRPNFGLPSGSIGSTAAGTITTVVTNARQIQFALRLHW